MAHDLSHPRTVKSKYLEEDVKATRNVLKSHNIGWKKTMDELIKGE